MYYILLLLTLLVLYNCKLSSVKSSKYTIIFLRKMSKVETLILVVLAIIIIYYLQVQIKNTEPFQNLNLGKESNAEFVYGQEGRIQLDKMTDKYGDLGKLEVPINMTDFGQRCSNWINNRGIKLPDNLTLPNQCVKVNDKYQCISDKTSGKLEPCQKLMKNTNNNNIQIPIKISDENIQKYINNHKKIEVDIKNLDTILSQLFYKYVEKENRIREQTYQIKQNGDLINLKNEKNTNLKLQHSTKTDNHEINTLILQKNISDKTEFIEKINYTKWYVKLLLFIIIIILFVMVLSANITSIAKLR